MSLTYWLNKDITQGVTQVLTQCVGQGAMRYKMHYKKHYTRPYKNYFLSSLIRQYTRHERHLYQNVIFGPFMSIRYIFVILKLNEGWEGCGIRCATTGPILQYRTGEWSASMINCRCHKEMPRMDRVRLSPKQQDNLLTNKPFNYFFVTWTFILQKCNQIGEL